MWPLTRVWSDRFRVVGLILFLASSLAGTAPAQEISEFPLSGGPSIFGGPDGFVYSGASRISTTTGAIEAFPPGASCFTLSGGMLYPPNVALGLGLDGNLWYSWSCPGDYLLHIPPSQAVGRMTSSGVALASAPAPIPQDSSVGPDGYLWGVGTGLGLVRIGTDLQVVTFPPPSLSTLGPTVGVTTDSSATVWFTYSLGAIGKKAPLENPVVFYQFAGGHQLGHVTTADDGNLWFIEATNDVGAVGRISPSGVVTEFPAPNVSVSLSGITAGPDGNVWFTEPGSENAPDDRVARITPDGVISEYATPSSASMPEAITTGPDGNIWFTEPGVGKIARLTINPNACHPTPTSLCLEGGRFRVEAQWQRPADVAPSPGNAVGLTSNTGYFWFFDAGNVEIVSKVLNGCSGNGHYWFFAGGLTNVGVQIKVTDTLSGLSTSYSNPVGTPFAPIQDTAAFSTCP